MARTVARPEPRRRLTWPSDAPAVGMHLGVGHGLLRAARRSRQIGATALQIFTDNPVAWRRRAEPPLQAPEFVDYGTREGLRVIAIHASYLINLAGSAEPFASQSRAGLITEMQRAHVYGATVVNTHIGSHRGVGAAAGLARIVENVQAVLAAARRRRPAGARELVRRRRHARLIGRGAGAHPGWRRRRCSALRLLPGHRPPVGRRLRHLLGRWGRGGRGSLRGAHRPRAAGARAPERLAIGARLAGGPARARRGGAHRSGGAGGVPAGSAVVARRRS